ncbi:hypothetical protein JST97_26640 [bacterium]|nr:hypothetical protein [bacterium]
MTRAGAGKRRTGLGLGVTLVVVSLIATLGFALASMSVSHLQLLSRVENEAYALDLARSTAHLAIEKIFSNRNFGATPTGDSSLNLHLPTAPPLAVGLLSFSPDQAHQLDIPLSLNNIAGARSLTSSGGMVVPPQSVHLVAVGRCRGVSRQVEVVLLRPAFPYAASSDGPIVSSGGLQVASRTSQDGAQTEPLKPADLQSNSGIRLGPDSVVHGDVRAGGQIQLNGTRVLGQVWPNSDPLELPRLKALDYDPGSGAINLQGTYSQPTFTGKLRRSGSLQVQGDVNLQGALLFVQGDLTIQGALKGTGVVVTTGQLTVTGQTEMTSADQVALLAGGRIRLEGQGQVGSSVRGVVYSEGGVVAHRLRLEGSLLSYSERENVQLDQVSLVRDPDAARVRIEIKNSMRSLTDFYLDPSGKVYSAIADAQNTVGRDGTYYWVHFEQGPDGRFAYHVCRNLFTPNYEPVDGVSRLIGTISPQDLLQPDNPEVQNILSVLQLNHQQLMSYLGLGTAAGGQQQSSEIVTIDPSQLLPLAQTARIALWREQ